MLLFVHLFICTSLVFTLNQYGRLCVELQHCFHILVSPPAPLNTSSRMDDRDVNISSMNKVEIKGPGSNRQSKISSLSVSSTEPMGTGILIPLHRCRFQSKPILPTATNASLRHFYAHDTYHVDICPVSSANAAAKSKKPSSSKI